MSSVLSLIGAKPGAVTPDHRARTIAALREAGVAAATFIALAEDRAYDCPLAEHGDRALIAARKALACEPIDVNLIPTEARRKRLLLADMDSTIITIECIDEIADFAGVKPQVAAITERAMRGELDFEEALRARVALLKGLPVDVLNQVFEERVRLTHGARALVRTMNAAGAVTALVSGGFTFFTERVAALTGFSVNQANRLSDDGLVLTGTVIEPILGRAAKRAMLDRLLAQHGLEPEAALAVGDGANDLEMIKAAGLGAAFHAKPIVAEAAGARIDHAGLEALLFLQGFQDHEIQWSA